MKFAYVSFVNENANYIELMRTTIQSVRKFSKYPLILYFVVKDVSNYKIPYINHNYDELIIQVIEDKLLDVYYYKPYVIYNALENGLESGYYIESDDVLTGEADEILEEEMRRIEKGIPLSPIHPDDVEMPRRDYEEAGCVERTQHYVHGHVLFDASCKDFVREWLALCMKSGYRYRNADETVLNMMYWKRNCRGYYMDIIDPWYETFYENEKKKRKVVSYHGCKDYRKQAKLLEDMIMTRRSNLIH
jgi:hypothetical protein